MHEGFTLYCSCSLGGVLFLQFASLSLQTVNSLLELKAEELVNIFSNPKGSHILDAFAQSDTIGVKSREKLAKRLKVNFGF